MSSYLKNKRLDDVAVISRRSRDGSRYSSSEAHSWLDAGWTIPPSSRPGSAHPGTEAVEAPDEEQKSEATVGQLSGALASETGALVRQEVQLAATEMTEKAKAAARSAGFIVAGGALLQVACVAVVLALMAGLYPTAPPWASAAVLGLLRRRWRHLGPVGAQYTPRTSVPDRVKPSPPCATTRLG